MLFFIFALAIFITGIRFYRQKDPAPIFGVYYQKGKWFPLKFGLFYVFLRIRNWIQQNFSTHSKENLSQQMDSPQPLSNDSKAFDAVFFMATNKKGFYFVAGSERRPLGIINGLCYLVVPEIGLLCSQKIPDTVLFGANDKEFGAEGILLKPMIPMKQWKVKFEGRMWLQADPSQEFDVNIEGDWKSDLPFFNFDTDMNPSALANTIATEVWTRKFFHNLKMAHQSHYEQMGSMTAKIKVNEKEYNEEMHAFRDHSYGNRRDWDLMHRYAFHMMFLDNGMKATVGVICQPCTGSMLQIGYVYTPQGDVYPLEWCDLLLYQHGEKGTPPTDHGFSFKAGPTEYHVQVNMEYVSTHYVGWKWEARMVERFVRYVVNGVPGRGISEFHYHNDTGRPDKFAKCDPQWFQTLKYK